MLPRVLLLAIASLALALPGPQGDSSDSVRITGDESDSVRITGVDTESVRITKERDVQDQEDEVKLARRRSEEAESVRITGITGVDTEFLRAAAA